MSLRRGARRIVLVLSLATLSPASVVEAAPPQGMPDPSQMSGIPRVDPSIPAGTVTVRCLIGSFANPSIGTEVELEINTEQGVDLRKATTVDKGRATFSGLEGLYGKSMVARATVAGQPLLSQAFVLGPEGGVALMLVAKADGQAAPVGPPHGQPQAGDPHGGQGDVPLPGKPFPLAGRPRGSLIVGALDLGGPEGGGLGPIPDIEVTLTISAPSLPAPLVETARTDAEGRALFEQLDARVPEGASLQVSAVLEPGQPPEQSEAFTLGESAYAVILTRGEGQAAARPSPPPQRQRMQLPPPRVDKTLRSGQTRVFVVDGNDQPVAGQLVVIHSSEATGGSVNHTGTTDAQGMVIIDDVPGGADMLSQVRVMYEGAPYSSTLFEMPADSGAVVMLRVYRPTGDRTRVRSALQLDVSARENDYAAVSFNYAVFVDGDEAFWVPGGMTIYGPPGTRSLHVMDEAKSWLLHDEEAPWFEIDRPLEPGMELRLSFAVGMEHDGSLELEWSTPFPLVDGGSLVAVGDELSVTHGVAGAPEVDPHAGRGGEPLKLYKLGYQPFSLTACDLLARARQPCPLGTWSGHDISVVVEGLPVRSRVWRYSAWALLGLGALGVVGALLLRRKVSQREALLARRDALIVELMELDRLASSSPTTGQRRARILRTLDRIYRQLEAISEPKAG